jgi:hypothetical protein
MFDIVNHGRYIYEQMEVAPMTPRATGRDATRRLAAVFGAVKFKSWPQLASSIGISRQHLHLVRSGLSTVGDELAGKLRETYGVSVRWLLEGQEPLFSTRRKNRIAVEQVILALVDLGEPSAGGLPLFESLSDVSVEHDLVSVPAAAMANAEPKEPAIMWRTCMVRATGPAASAQETGFYIVADGAMAAIVDVRPGDFVLLEHSREYFRSRTPQVGDHLTCILSSARRKHLCVVEIVDVVSRHPRTGRATSDVEHDLEYEGPMLKFFFARLGRRDAPRSARLFAVAVRSERDLTGGGAG